MRLEVMANDPGRKTGIFAYSAAATNRSAGQMTLGKYRRAEYPTVLLSYYECSMPAPIRIPFDNAYARLPAQCFARVLPTPVANPALIRFNHGLAAELGIELNGSSAAELAAAFAGNDIPAGADALATAYAGHQVGQLDPPLGGGPAMLSGDVVDIHGQRRDIQLKGSGRTPFSRNGDGRSPLGPVLREYILCEAMHALGVPTTRALAAVNSGEWVYREGREPGAVF